MRHAAAALVAAFLAPVAMAAEIFLAGTPKDHTNIREFVSSWQEETGNSVIWLYGIEAGDVADLYITNIAAARSMHAAGELVPVTLHVDPETWLPPPLLHETLGLHGSNHLIALPVAPGIPTLRADTELLAKAGASLPTAPGWNEIFDLASRAADPIGNVYGLCVAGFFHATMIRSMMSDEGAIWLDGGEPYLGDPWVEPARRYARSMASFGPPNAADLEKKELRQLVSEQRCAIWLKDENDPIKEGEQITGVPGASAFASYGMRVVGVAEKSGRRALAKSLAWWISENAVKKITSDPAQGKTLALALQQPGSHEVYATGRPSYPLSWLYVDEVAQDAFREMVHGLVPAADAIDKAADALTESI